MTTRDCKEADFEAIGGYLLRARQIALDVQTQHGKKLVDFTAGLEGNAEIESLKADVEAWASAMPFPS